MRTEIEILLRASTRNCAVVEKETNVLWSSEDLLEARASGRYQNEDRLLPPDAESGVTGPYPGCLQQGSALSALNYRPIGQTNHFIIFTTGNVPDGA
jgi:hypothetical protein